MKTILSACSKVFLLRILHKGISISKYIKRADVFIVGSFCCLMRGNLVLICVAVSPAAERPLEVTAPLFLYRRLLPSVSERVLQLSAGAGDV